MSSFMEAWTWFNSIFHNPFIFAVGILQIVGGIYSYAIGDWRLGVINFTVGIANSTLSTLKG